MQRAESLSSNAVHHQQVGVPSWWVNDSNRGVREEHRVLSSSSGSSLSTYSTGTYGDREVVSCLQWDCEPGYYSESLPLCHHGDFTPSDDYRGEESDVDECSDETCCEIEETDVYTCKQYPHSCPSGLGTLLVACTLGAADGYPICGEGACCGVGGVNPDGPSPVSTWAPITTTPTPESATRPPTPVPLTAVPPVQPTPTPTQTPTQTPTRTPTQTPPTNAPVWGTQPAARDIPAPLAALPPTRTPVTWVEPAASASTPTIGKASPTPPPSESPAASTTVPISWTTAPRPVVNEPAIAPEPSNGRPVPEPVPPAVRLLSGWPEPPTWNQAPWQEVPIAPVQETTAHPTSTTSAPTPLATLQPTRTITEEPSSARRSWTEQPMTEPPLETPRPSTGAPVTSPTLSPTAGPVVPARPGTPSPTMPYVTEAPLPETLVPMSTPSPSRTPPPVTKAPDIGAATDAPDVGERTAVASPPPTDLTTKDPVSTPIPDNPSTSVPAEDASVAPATAPESAAPVLSTVAPSSHPISLPGEPEKYLRQAAVAANTMSILAVMGIIAALMGSLFASTGAGSASSRATSMMEVAGARSATSVRAPSTTMALVLTGQLQFLATLSLVDSPGAADSLVSEFTDHLRWVNLWPPEDVVTEFTQLSTARRLQEATGGGFKCMFAEAESGDIGAIVCAGNLMLLLGILLSIFIVHLAVASGVEAYWLTKQHAEEMVELAGHRALPVRDLSISRWGKSVVRVYPNTSSTDEVVRPPTSRRLRQWHSQSSLSVDGRSEDRMDHFSDDDDEEEGCPTPSCGEGRSSLVSECRDRSHSAWLHFPHIELVFLFFGFEGAFAAEVSALRESWCPWVMFMAVAALILYPALMFVMVCRIIFVRVRPDDLIVFEPVPDAEDSDGSSCGDHHNQHRRSLFSRVKLGWDESSSLFTWADKGQWTTTDTADEEARREGDWFRIGFEPLFVDFTKRGSWFMAYSLAQSAALASVGILVDESARQLWLFCGLHLVCCILLVLFKPFANRLVNAVGACLAGADALCMAILAVSVLAWEGTENATKADKAVVVIQLLVLIALVIPMYVDASAFFIDGVRERLKRKAAEARVHSAEGERKFVRRYIRRAWPSTWCSMLGKNMFACVADTSAGVRRPRPSTSTTSPASMRKDAADKAAAQVESFPVRRRKVPPPPSP